MGGMSSPSGGDSGLTATLEALRAGLGYGWHGCAAVHVTGPAPTPRSVVVGRTLDGVELAVNALVPWFCTAKPLLTLLAARLVTDKELSWDDPVVRHVPEFGRGGNAAASVRDVLTHSIGLRVDPVELTGLDRELALRIICRTATEPGWSPGREHSYLPFTGWYLMGEILRRCGGADLDRLLTREVLRPLGLNDTHVGMSAEEYARHAPRLVPVATRQIRAGHGEHRYRLPIDGPDVCCDTGPISVRGTLADLAALYAVLGLAADPPLGIAEEVWHQCLDRPASAVFDHRHQIPVFLGLGVKFEGRKLGERARTFGPGCGPGTVGHRGLGSLVAYADPDAGLAVAAFFDVTEQPLVNRGRIDLVSVSVYEDLGVA